jgi:hypothetical protein
MTPWEIEGRELINCNCSYGCPCQFSALPTHGFCEANGAIIIDRGHYGSVSLDGLKFAIAFKWPGPIHEGKGKGQPFVDARADAAQREAILKILSGQDTDPFATVFAVFATTLEQVFEPIFAPIEVEIDVDARRGRARIEHHLEIEGRPIRNPVTGAEQRARIDLPHGFEYEIAEVASGTSRSQGHVAVALSDSYAQFARLHMNNHGLIRHRSAA